MSVGSTPFRRVNPHPGLMIDADVWRDAHDYHREQLGLHHLALHGWGILQGLDVSLVEGSENTLRIESGFAIDPAGRFVIVPRSQTYQITAREKQAVYLIVQFRDVLAEPAGSAPTRIVEAYRIQERDRLPEEPYIELARIDFDPRSGALKAAREGKQAGRNELDLSSRRRVGGGAPPMPVRSSSDGAGENGLAPRIESLGQQLGSLTRQVEQLSADVATARQAAPAPGAKDGPSLARLDGLASQVQQLTRRVESLGEQRSASEQSESVGEPRPASEQPASVEQTQPPAQAQSSLTAEQVSGLVADQLSGLLQRIDSAAYQGEALAQQVTSAQQHQATDVQELGVRVDGLRSEIDSLGLQVQALAQQVDTLPSTTRAAPAPFEPTAPQTHEPQRRVLRVAPAEHATGGWDVHREGLRFLARELSAMSDVSAQVVSPVRVREAVGIELLYLSGHGSLTLDNSDVEAIGRLLDDGAVVIGEGCATGPNGEAGAREFAMSFVDLGIRLGRQLTRVDRGHPMMVARHVFGELPGGARATARVLEASGMVYSDADYGCAWQGGPADRPLARSVIRDALEFGTNVALFRRNGHRG